MREEITVSLGGAEKLGEINRRERAKGAGRGSRATMGSARIDAGHRRGQRRSRQNEKRRSSIGEGRGGDEAVIYRSAGAGERTGEETETTCVVQ